MRPWLQHEVWRVVAAELAEHRQAGLERLLTEDVVRFAAARALVAQGCDATQLRLEWPHPALRGSRVDLVVGSPPTGLIEFKYPREPNEQNAAWTMTLGEVLKDLYRLAVLPDGDRVFVFVETARLYRYMTGAATRFGLSLDSDDVALEPAAARTLPPTAAQIIGPELLARRVTAKRLCVMPVGDALRLSVYLVDAAGQALPPQSAPEVAPAAAGSEISVVHDKAARPRLSAVSRSGARGEIQNAVRAVLLRSGHTTFTVDEVVREMHNAGTRYAESTIRTMITSHLCANAPNHAAVTYQDFDRVGRGLYRLHRP